MPPTVDTRILHATDVDLLRQMLAMFAEAFEDPEAYASRPPDDAYLHALLQRDTFIAVAAQAQGRVVGGLAGYVLPKFEQARSEFYLYDLAVLEAWRRQGIATGLIDALRQEAARRGIGVIFVQADRGDDPAVALYEGLGTREDVFHFDILPGPVSAPGRGGSGA